MGISLPRQENRKAMSLNLGPWLEHFCLGSAAGPRQEAHWLSYGSGRTSPDELCQRHIQAICPERI
jgi:hypothetical protein